MQSHLWSRSAETMAVRVCTSHAAADPEDPNVTCEGFEVRFERASAVDDWSGDDTGRWPEIELVIRRIRSRWGEPQLGEVWSDIDTSTVGPALRMSSDEGFALL